MAAVLMAVRCPVPFVDSSVAAACACRFRIEIGNEGWKFLIGDPATKTLDHIVGANVSQTNAGSGSFFGDRLTSRLNIVLTRQFRLGFLVEQAPPAGSTTDYFRFYGAGHTVGTYRIGTSPAESVVNPEQRSWDHPNLFLVGSGVFPTVATGNPTLTLAALALWAAETILRDLG